MSTMLVATGCAIGVLATITVHWIIRGVRALHGQGQR